MRLMNEGSMSVMETRRVNECNKSMKRIEYRSSSNSTRNVKSELESDECKDYESRSADDGMSVWVRDEMLGKTLRGDASVRMCSVGERRASLGWSQGLVMLENDDSCRIEISDDESPFHSKSVRVSQSMLQSDDVLMANPQAEPPHDLIHLTHLHEPAVMHALRHRYVTNNIYTNTGPILLALNPFKESSHLYTDAIMQHYAKHSHERQLPPHVFAVADSAFRAMMRAIEDGLHPDQTILVSGESGAGKTVTTKIIMQYLAMLSNKHTQLSSQKKRHPIEQQLLHSNPVLESFGNARTIRNDNSSRFGKFIEIHFSTLGRLHGAKIHTYLLEKVRLIDRSRGERNYHIFYELLEGVVANVEHRQILLLESPSTGKSFTPQDFVLTSSISNTYHRRDGVRDDSTYTQLCSALETMNMEEDQQLDVFEVISSLLHLSNITFIPYDSSSSPSSSSKPSSPTYPSTPKFRNVRKVHQNSTQQQQQQHWNEAFVLDTNNPYLACALELMGVSLNDLQNALCTITINVSGEVLIKKLNYEKCTKALEALIKATYAALFEFVVNQVNACIMPSRYAPNDPTTNTSTAAAFIGVLDIFGFESFQTNSFEQICINYCNESLQQQFNKFVFQLEQDEYEREGIEWSFIHFPDNQNVLDLMDKKHVGILSLLDEQCMLPSCTDRSFANALYKTCTAGGGGMNGGCTTPRHFSASFNENNRSSFFSTSTTTTASCSSSFSQSTPSLSPSTISTSSCSSSTNSSVQKQEKQQKEEAIFLADTRQRARGFFSIKHYAGPVEYDTSGFLEKNKDELPKEATTLLLSSENRFLRHLADIMSTDKSTSGSVVGASNSNVAVSRRTGLSHSMSSSALPSSSSSSSSSLVRVSVGGQFSSQLRLLRSRIDITRPHYIRCLKPNDNLVPDTFEPAVIADQLRYGGILEAIRVSRIGYSQRYAHSDFVRRYKVLALEELRKGRSPVKSSTNGAGRMTNRGFMGQRTPEKSLTTREECQILVQAIGRKIRKSKGDLPKERSQPQTTFSSPQQPSKESDNRGQLSRNASSWIKDRSMQQTSPSSVIQRPTTRARANVATLSSIDLMNAGLQMGKTKVFLRQDAFDSIERERNKLKSYAATLINATARMYLCRVTYRHALYLKYREIEEARERFARNLAAAAGIKAGDATEMIRRFEEDVGLDVSAIENWKGAGEEREFKWMMVDGRWVRNEDGVATPVQ